MSMTDRCEFADQSFGVAAELDRFAEEAQPTPAEPGRKSNCVVNLR